MKIFEEFENALNKCASGIKEFAKCMLANGVKEISVNDKQVSVLVTEFGLIENVPKEKWSNSNQSYYPYKAIIVARYENIMISCEIEDKTDFSKRTGYVFVEEENNESK